MPTDSSLMQLLMMTMLLTMKVPAATEAKGQNLCRNRDGYDCCPGWQRDAHDQCTVAVCPNGCNGGYCIGPNLCYCVDGTVSDSCGQQTHRSCRVPCQNGGECKNGRCECKSGYSGTACQTAHCPRFCNGRGICDRNQKCRCNDGFGGEACEIVLRAACYADTCGGRLLTDRPVTREQCCNTFGRAWGSQCSRCTRSVCGFGRVRQRDACISFSFCSLPGVCNGGTCHESGGSFICQCASGKIFNSKLKICDSPPDYCQRHSLACGIGGDCVSSGISYRCVCKAGFLLRSDHQHCDTSPCLGHTACSPGRCVATNASHVTCSCPIGWEAVGRKCRMRTYCTLNPHACGNGTCVPVGEFFTCRCNSGFAESVSGLDCLPVTSAPSTLRACDGRCVNGECRTIGESDFVCSCNSGFRAVAGGKVCVPEAAGDSAGQSGVIDCPDGFCRNGSCSVGSGGGLRCLCRLPLRLSSGGSDCRLPPFCEVFRSTCVNGSCVSRGHDDFICNCSSGFVASDDGRTCVSQADSDSINVCHSFKVCQNGQCVDMGSGRFTCRCFAGFAPSADGRHCHRESQDPLSRLLRLSFCRRFPRACGRGVCIDLAGSHDFTCACQKGFRLSEDKRFCAPAAKKLFGFCARRPLACGGTGHCSSVGDSDFRCFCYHGYRQGDSDKECLPYDYNQGSLVIHGVNSKLLADSSSKASKNSSSSSTPGGVKSASLRSAASCSDGGDESCGGGGSCRDVTDGGFTCECKIGFTLTDDGFTCVDIDECANAGNSLCLAGECVNTVGSYTCRCRSGFVLSDSKVCVDRNECEQPDICVNGECVNQWGTYECRCHHGYKNLPSDAKSCVKNDTQEMTIEISSDLQSPLCPDCRLGCLRTGGQLNCECLVGHKLVNSALCAPRSVSVVSSRSSSRQIEIELEVPAEVSLNDLTPARRSLRLLGCSLVAETARARSVTCRLAK